MPAFGAPLTAVVFGFVAFFQTPTAPAPEAGRDVQMTGIKVTGTRLPAASVVRLTGLQVGATVNDALVRKACQRITNTGLVKTVDYAYDVYPDKPGAELVLTIVDEGPIVPATIIPAEQEGALWSALQKLDPMFMKTLPPTQKALAFYVRNMEECLHTSGKTEQYVASKTTGDQSGTPTAIVFEIGTYKNNGK